MVHLAVPGISEGHDLHLGDRVERFLRLLVPDDDLLSAIPPSRASATTALHHSITMGSLGEGTTLMLT
jgi:hypothetical protein